MKFWGRVKLSDLKQALRRRIAWILKPLVLVVLSFDHKSFTSSVSFWESNIQIVNKCLGRVLAFRLLLDISGTGNIHRPSPSLRFPGNEAMVELFLNIEKYSGNQLGEESSLLGSYNPIFFKHFDTDHTENSHLRSDCFMIRGLTVFVDIEFLHPKPPVMSGFELGIRIRQKFLRSLSLSEILQILVEKNCGFTQINHICQQPYGIHQLILKKDHCSCGMAFNKFKAGPSKSACIVSGSGKSFGGLVHSGSGCRQMHQTPLVSLNFGHHLSEEVELTPEAVQESDLLLTLLNLTWV
ncbi:hypothetical protein Tco_1061409 [Tanacetum coccineum]